MAASILFSGGHPPSEARDPRYCGALSRTQGRASRSFLAQSPELSYETERQTSGSDNVEPARQRQRHLSPRKVAREWVPSSFTRALRGLASIHPGFLGSVACAMESRGWHVLACGRIGVGFAGSRSCKLAGLAALWLVCAIRLGWCTYRIRWCICSLTGGR